VNNAPRETTINLRAPATKRALIDQAAEIAGKTRTDFMLEASCEKAQEVLADRTRFVLNAEQLDRFNAILEAPMENPEALARLIATPAPWES
jgi:uncharacterized protein (DUF1778 family)